MVISVLDWKDEICISNICLKETLQDFCTMHAHMQASEVCLEKGWQESWTKHSWNWSWNIKFLLQLESSKLTPSVAMVFGYAFYVLQFLHIWSLACCKFTSSRHIWKRLIGNFSFLLRELDGLPLWSPWTIIAFYIFLGAYALSWNQRGIVFYMFLGAYALPSRYFSAY